MLVNKKLDRFKQWAGEKMGGEVKTGVSDDFKALETEMNLRHEGAWPLGLALSPNPLTLRRYGTHAAVHDRLRQIAL